LATSIGHTFVGYQVNAGWGLKATLIKVLPKNSANDLVKHFYCLCRWASTMRSRKLEWQFVRQTATICWLKFNLLQTKCKGATVHTWQRKTVSDTIELVVGPTNTTAHQSMWLWGAQSSAPM
jgi:hypothetical protein